MLFLDECLGHNDVAEALRKAGATVERHRDHFDAGTDDQEWLREVGRRGWVVLTKDKRIRHRQAERRALEDSGVAAFVLTGGTMSSDGMARAFRKALDRIRKLMRDREPPFIATVNANGRVRLLTNPPRRAARRKKGPP